MRRLFILYDARCGLCRQARRWLEAQEQILDLVFLAAGSDAARRLFPTLGASEHPEELVVVADDGGVYRGGNAWILCLYALEEYRDWSERLATPALLPLARRAFDLLSGQRGRISRWLGLASEAEIADALARVASPSCEVEFVGKTSVRTQLESLRTDRHDWSRTEGIEP